MKRFYSKPTGFPAFLALAGTLLAFSLNTTLPSFIGLKGHKIRLIPVPGGFTSLPPRPTAADDLPQGHSVSGFWMTRSEIQVQTFCQFLSRYPDLAAPYGGQVSRCGGQVRPFPGFARKPVTHVSAADAELFCRWLSEVSGRTCRLPTPAEWIHMAGSGQPGTAYPWGWEGASKRAGFRQTGPKDTGFYGPVGLGLVDVIGNVYEWSRDPIGRKTYIHGGAWSDRHEFSLHIHHLYEQPPAHRSADIGFRVLVEMPSAEPPASLTSPAKAL